MPKTNLYDGITITNETGTSTKAVSGISKNPGNNTFTTAQKTISSPKGYGRGGKPKPQPSPDPPSPGPITMDDKTFVVDPVTRLEGHLKITVRVDMVNGVQQVVNAWATGTLFRGFENLLVGRHPMDAQHITQRICGVCPVSHGVAAILALDKAYNMTVSKNHRIMRNLVMAANMIDSHILHFYHLALPDFVGGPANMAPWSPDWLSSEDKARISNYAGGLQTNYVAALDFRRKAHEMGAIFGGRMPHPPTYIPGGFTTTPTSTMISSFKTYVDELYQFVAGRYLNDVKNVVSVYGDYLTIGKGPGNLLAFGTFPLDSGSFFNPGYIGSDGTRMGFNQLTSILNSIGEQVTYSWYNNATSGLNPSAGQTVPVDPHSKTAAYSWLKAPRLTVNGAQVPCEAGPLARVQANNWNYRAQFGLSGVGVSVMDRHLARAYEAFRLLEAMINDNQGQWINGLQASSLSTPQPGTANSSTVHWGATEAPRGALAHWLKVDGSGNIQSYQVLTPTCWNASPRDSNGVLGPIEQALLGTPVANTAKPIEVLRVIHSFDPCLSCAVHVMRPDEGKKVFVVPHFHGGEEIHTHDHDHGHCHRGHSHAHDHDHGPDHDH